MDVAELKASAAFRPRGRSYEDFEIGATRHHHWGRTIAEADAVQFSYLTLSYNPMYFNIEYARAHGHPGLVVNPHLVFNIALGLSVEDNSEGLGGPFVSVFELAYRKAVYVGDTITARSTTIEKRITKGDSGKGIVTWHTEGFNQNEERVIDFKRSNLAIFKASKMIREGTLWGR